MFWIPGTYADSQPTNIPTAGPALPNVDREPGMDNLADTTAYHGASHQLDEPWSVGCVHSEAEVLPGGGTAQQALEPLTGEREVGSLAHMLPSRDALNAERIEEESGDIFPPGAGPHAEEFQADDRSQDIFRPHVCKCNKLESGIWGCKGKYERGCEGGIIW